MWEEHRIACVTYHKFPKDDWPTSEFSEVTGTIPHGEVVTMKLAERGSRPGRYILRLMKGKPSYGSNRNPSCGKRSSSWSMK